MRPLVWAHFLGGIVEIKRISKEMRCVTNGVVRTAFSVSKQSVRKSVVCHFFLVVGFFMASKILASSSSASSGLSSRSCLALSRPWNLVPS